MVNDPNASSLDLARTPWRFGRFDARPRHLRLLFGHMFEDPALERQLFPPGARVFCIASAGCTAMNLARHGWRVTAVDINPSQIDYIKRRLTDGAPEQGAADRLLALMRRAASLCGVRRKDLEEFVRLNDPAAQLRFWNERINRRALRTVMNLLLAPRSLRLVYASPFVRALPDRFADLLWSRLARGISLHSNGENPFASLLFLGRELESDVTHPPPDCEIELATADAVDFLSDAAAGSFQAFSLSNIVDGVEPSFINQLVRAIHHAAAPEAVVVVRSFAEPRDDVERTRAAADRSFLWGRIVVCRVEDLAVAMFATK